MKITHTFKEYKAMARQSLHGKYGLAVAICFLFAAISATTYIMLQTVSSQLLSMLLSYLQLVIMTGFSYFFLNIARDCDYNLTDLFVMLIPGGKLSMILELFIFSCITELLSMACAFPALLIYTAYVRYPSPILAVIGFVVCTCGLFVLIYFMLGLSMYVFVLLDFENRGMTVGAFRIFIAMSWNMMKGQRLRYFLFNLSFFGWYLLGIVTLGIGLLWVVPYHSTSMAFFYLDLSENFIKKISDAAQSCDTTGSSFDQYV